MGKNAIEQFDESMAMVVKIKELRQLLDEMRTQQAPTIGLSGGSTVDWTLQPYNRSTNEQSQSTVAILARLIPGGTGIKTLFALPEIEMYGHPTAPAIDNASQYPGGSNWNLPAGNNAALFDLDVWYDLWHNELGTKQAAIIYVRNRSPHQMAIKVVIRWRSILPGSTTA